MRRGSNRAFTLVEVVISTALIAVGVVAVMATFGAINATGNRLNVSEMTQRLAQEQVDELIATAAYTAAASGQWDDLGYAWTSSTSPTGIENLQTVTVRVTSIDRTTEVLASATAYIFVPPVQTGGSQ